MLDAQGLLRGECACGDCQEFTVQNPDNNSVRCDYCDCCPSMHKRIIQNENKSDNDFSDKDIARTTLTIARHKCQQCNMMFTDKFSRLCHEDKEHGVKGNAACKIDKNGFIIAEKSLKLEYAQVIKEEPAIIMCPNCDKTFKKRRYLMKHLRKSCKGNHDFEEPAIIMCPNCDTTFKEKRYLTKHLRKSCKGNHKSPKRNCFTCLSCLEQFNTKNMLQNHMVMEHGLKQDKDTSDYPQLEHKEVNPELFNSDDGSLNVVDNIFSNIVIVEQRSNGNLLDGNIVSSQKTAVLMCQFCGKTYKTKEDLEGHERSHGGIRPYKCLICGKSFASKHVLRGHKRVHVNKGAFTCQFCGNSFNTKEGLKHHEMIHTGEKPFPCSVCTKPFRHKSMLAVHMRIHTGEKPYKCNYCPKAFRDYGTHRKHERIHTLEKPYKCHMCDKAYNQKWCLTEHLKYHLADGTLMPKNAKIQNVKIENINLEKPYKCLMCDKAYNQKWFLTEHLKKYHLADGTLMPKNAKIQKSPNATTSQIVLGNNDLTPSTQDLVLLNEVVTPTCTSSS